MRSVIDLPFPPSVNAVWRKNNANVYRSGPYMKWLKAADGEWIVQKRGVQKIKGRYSLEIFLAAPDNRHRDLGNYEKVLSDFAQRVGIIDNDRRCRKLTIEWVEAAQAPLGARMVFAASN